MGQTERDDEWRLASDEPVDGPGTDPDPAGLIDALPEPVYVIDRRGQFRDCNERFYTEFGYTDEELAAMDPIELVDSADRDRARTACNHVARGEEVEQELRLVTSDGDRRLCGITHAPLTDDDGEVWGAVVTVCESSVHNEHERDHELYERLIETVGDGVYVLDEDRKLQRVNDGLVEMTGYERGELLGMHITEIVPDETVAEAKRRLLQRADDEDAVVTMEGQVMRDDGTTLPVESRFSFWETEQRTIGLVRDISERKDRETLLERLHEGVGELMTAKTVEAVAETATHVARRQFGFAKAGVRLLTDDDRLVLTALDLGDGLAETSYPDYAVGEGFVGRAYERGETVVYDDLGAVETEFEYDPIQSVMLLPIEGYGIVSIAATEPAAFDETDRDLARLFAAGVESAFQRADREQQLRERKQELQLYETLIETMSDSVYATDADHRITMVNEATLELTGLSHEEIIGRDIREFLDPADVEEATRQQREMLKGDREFGRTAGTIRTADGSETPIEDRFSLLPADDGTFAGTVGVVRDVTERKEHERQLKTQRDELETLVRVTELVQETIASLAGAGTREEIEESVCEHLAASPLYRFAFTGTCHSSLGDVVPQSWAGDGGDYLEAVDVPAHCGDPSGGPIGVTMETGEVTVTDDIESDALFEPLREAALDQGFRSAALVPFTHGELFHGFLGVFADRPDAFSDREVHAFEVLGEIVGFAISATQDRRLIESDTVLALSITLSETDSFLATVSERFDSPCRIIGSANASDEGWLHYVAVSGAPPDAVEEMADPSDPRWPTEIRLVSEDDDESVFEIRTTESIPSLLLESGVRPIEVVAEDGVISTEVEATHDADLRAITERLESRFGTVSLETKREVERRPDPPGALREQLNEWLTDRQRATLQAAYYGGYFEWPRESTAEDIAASLDISSPTFHQHLRHALRKSLSALLTDGDE